MVNSNKGWRLKYWILATGFSWLGPSMLLVAQEGTRLSVENTSRSVPSVQVEPLPNEQVSFVIDGKEVTRLHYGSLHRRPFFYPVSAQQGISLTRMGHPHDAHGHSHHNSLWMSHVAVNGVDFWSDRGEQAGVITLDRLPPKAFEDGGGDSASFTMDLSWHSDSSHLTLLREQRRNQVISLEGARSWLLIWESKFTIPEKDSSAPTVTFDATPFGLAAVRMAKSK